MLKFLLPLSALAGLLTACQTQPTETPAAASTPAAGAPQTPTQPTASEAAADDVAGARQWLMTSVEDYYHTDSPGADAKADTDTTAGIYTRRYKAYKLESINLEFAEDQDKAIADFEKKWAGQYNTKYVGTGGFLFTAQDYGNLKVTRCTFKERTKDNGYLFNVTIRDVTYKMDNQGDIKVLQTDQGYKIDDVLEY
ncbi:hypothetical protein HNQ93_002882 [Hymenobacter luteus]|uniref:Uncharacterized protein n=2 Tax=Hymenobacter TaxID=89966 RepID=A0A7W9WDV0_9BACT|nr:MULTISPECIES: hypothetical protein [Hymenobacter]MBB4601550.1 hypothetical protein [Hymenobacter latericoloratus]MBB6060022.1 hypothetical protein [Hymenobacter luteus]